MNIARHSTWWGGVAAIALMVGCTTAPTDEPEADLGPIENIVSEIDATMWPGNVLSDGSRHVRRINGFWEGEPTAYWFAGFASRIPADVFWFCREGDPSCPLGVDGVIDRSRTVGRPVFARIPGDTGFSPFWRIWVVQVPDDYQPNEIKSVAGIDRASRAGRVQVTAGVFDHGGTIGQDMAIMHCLLVLTDTTLEHNGADLISQPGVPSMFIPSQLGWHKQHRVEFFDYTISEGVFAPDPSSESIALMRFGDIFVMFRDCDGGSQMKTCEKTSSALSAVSERGIETDLTNDDDRADSNNIISAVPHSDVANPIDRLYSPLWRVMRVRIRPEHDDKVVLIDSTGDQNDTILKTPDDVRGLAQAGFVDPPTTVSEAAAGNPIIGNDNVTMFNCPSQVAAP